MSSVRVEKKKKKMGQSFRSGKGYPEAQLYRP